MGERKREKGGAGVILKICYESTYAMRIRIVQKHESLCSHTLLRKGSDGLDQIS